MAQKKQGSGANAGGFIAATIIAIVVTAALVGVGVYFISSKTYEKDKESMEENMDKLRMKMTNIEGTLREASRTPTPASTPQNVSVRLFYYNTEKDRDLSTAMKCSPDAVLAVERTLPLEPTIVQDTLALLFRGELTAEEKKGGFTSLFPMSDLTLKSASLNGGTLTLEFDDPKNFISGGACKAGVIRTQIEKTVMQFEPIKEVKFLPDKLFE